MIILSKMVCTICIICIGVKNNMKSNWEEACQKVADNLVTVLISKQRDYGKNNILDFGEYGILVRINDKVSRLKNLAKNQTEPKNESIDDTWTDVAGYAVLAKMVREGSFELPFEEDVDNDDD